MSKKVQAKAPVGITSVLHEERVFPPSKEFSLRAHVKSLGQYQKLYKESINDPEKFWGRMAEQELVWFKPWKSVLKWKAPDAKWFADGTLVQDTNGYESLPLASIPAGAREIKLVVWDDQAPVRKNRCDLAFQATYELSSAR